jgi:hypothetical protein
VLVAGNWELGIIFVTQAMDYEAEGFTGLSKNVSNKNEAFQELVSYYKL